MKIKTKLIAALALACAFTGGAGILKASAADFPHRAFDSISTAICPRTRCMTDWLPSRAA